MPRPHPHGSAAAPRRIAPVALLIAAGITNPALAQSSAEPGAAASTAAAAAAPARAVAAPASPVPTLDGSLDDAAWAAAAPIGDFVQRQPEEGRPATQRTEVRFLYGPDALWIGARMYDDAPSRIQAPVARRDDDAQADQILVSLDTYRDRLTAYTFGVTASGVRLDRFHASDREDDADEGWDPVWEARARVDSLGWTAEMRIPWSQLRFTDAAAQVWGVDVKRWIPARNEWDYWVLVPTDEIGWASRFGTLEGIRDIDSGRRVEFLPYAAAEATFRDDADPADPFHGPRNATARVGADVKMGLGPSLTLQGTVNPDFGQVEADPAVVNLSAYEVQFDEKRPFFTEGADVFDVPGPAYFYSRRIGAPPPGRIAADYVDRPATSTILGSAKVTGRIDPRTGVGALAAVTAEEDARYVDSTGDVASAIVAPRTLYGVGRIRRQLGASGSTAGVILSAMHRSMATGSPLAAQLDRDAVAGGVDGTLRVGGGAWVLGGNVGFSTVAGDSAAMLRRQLSSARYWQRPDASYLSVDPARTRMSGLTGGAFVQKNNGHWIGSAQVSTATPGFEINDVGILSNADVIDANARFGYQQTRPGPFLRTWQVTASKEEGWNYGGVHTWNSVRSDAALTFPNFWRLDMTGWVDMRHDDPWATRGGPILQIGQAWVTIARLGSNPASPTSWYGRAYYGESETGELTYRLSGSLGVRPGPRWQLSVTPNYLFSRSPRQYLATLPGGPAATFGQRYVFGFIDQTEVSATLRLTLAFTPDLTLQIYAEPFAGAGRAYRPGELTTAGGRGLRFYGQAPGTSVRRSGSDFVVTDGAETFDVPAPDYTLRSLRSNAVLRWEWRPGSTLYLVWQEDRHAFGDVGRRADFADFFRTFGTTGDHRVAVKVNYFM